MELTFAALAVSLLSSFVTAQSTICAVDAFLPPPAGLTCGSRGRLSTPSVLTTLQATGFQSSCAELCLRTTGCVVFGFSPSTEQCTLYGRTLSQMGWRSSSAEPNYFWRRECFQSKGDCPALTFPEVTRTETVTSRTTIARTTITAAGTGTGAATATVTLPPSTITLPPSTITLPPSTVTLPPSTVTLPPSTVTVPGEVSTATSTITDVSTTTTIVQGTPETSTLTITDAVTKTETSVSTQTATAECSVSTSSNSGITTSSTSTSTSTTTASTTTTLTAPAGSAVVQAIEDPGFELYTIDPGYSLWQAKQGASIVDNIGREFRSYAARLNVDTAGTDSAYLAVRAPTTPGAKYTLTYWTLSTVACAVCSYSVGHAGDVFGEEPQKVDSGSLGEVDTEWKFHVVDFTPTTRTTRLFFTANAFRLSGTGGGTLLIDDVQLTGIVPDRDEQCALVREDTLERRNGNFDNGVSGKPWTFSQNANLTRLNRISPDQTLQINVPSFTNAIRSNDPGANDAIATQELSLTKGQLATFAFRYNMFPDDTQTSCYIRPIVNGVVQGEIIEQATRRRFEGTSGEWVEKAVHFEVPEQSITVGFRAGCSYFGRTAYTFYVDDVRLLILRNGCDGR